MGAALGWQGLDRETVGMAFLEHGAPRLPAAEAVRIARELYGLTATAQALPGEYDDNFHLRAAPGGEFTLKVMRAGVEPELVALQCGALAHAAEQATVPSLPRVQKTLAGQAVGAAQVSDGTERLVWMLTYVPGRLLAETRPHSAELLYSLGQFMGRLDAALAGFSHPAAERELKWDLARAGWIRGCLHYVSDPERRKLVERLFSLYENEVEPALPGLRRSVIHNDANDYNVLVELSRREPRQVVSVIDFGDMLRTQTAGEPAVAAAYALLGKTDPLAAAASVVAGYHSAFPLDEKEIALLFPLICARLCVSVVNSAYRRTLEPGDPYVTISEAPAWAALERLASVHPRFAHYAFRQACGLTPVPHSQPVADWLRAQAPFSPVVDVDLRQASSTVFDLSVGSLLVGADPQAAETAALTETLFGELRRRGARVGIGRYDEARPLYRGPAFGKGGHPTDEHRTVHLGIDLFVEPGTPVHAPLEGSVHCLANDAAHKDYGPLIILKHAVGEGTGFFTLYGHLSEESLSKLVPGQRIERGERIATVGAPPANGDWPPHLHFQLIVDLLELDRDFPGVGFASERKVWLSLSPDPNLILGIPAERFPAPEATKSQTLAVRRERIGRSLRLSYRQPVKILRGWMQYVYDETGRCYLDAYNNVPHVGHSHPRVVRAAQAQMALLNTNTRYLHDNLVRYAERLCAKLPEPLRVCFFVNSGSEANELALRLARTHTGRHDIVALANAYHGHTTTLVDISSYKFLGPGGQGRKPWVHIAPLPDDYRGPYRRDDPEAGRKYARQVAEIVVGLKAHGGPAAFICESLPSVGGQIVLPPNYLAKVYHDVRAAGGVCIADEVQVGLGRLGTHFWGFETQGVVPDIVVLGKPIGNGHPLGAVVTTPEIAASFDNGMEFFSTFGGNTVSCAVGLAVLEVIEEERLQEHARRVGDHLLASLRGLMEKHRVLGDVRGLGLFVGVELVRDRTTLEPAEEETAYVVNRLRERSILTGSEGHFNNVIKIRPPLPFNAADADLLVNTLDDVLGEDLARS
jgi:4-aminobutyrate aminotransferase-like enzyme/Ser/Thr protein kinase RdoA (MazF antagonist)